MDFLQKYLIPRNLIVVACPKRHLTQNVVDIKGFEIFMTCSFS